MPIQLTVSPSAVGFAPTLVGTSATKSSVFTVKNVSAGTIKLTGVRYSRPDGDLVTLPEPSLYIPQQDSFSVVPHSATFPVTLTAGTSQAFDVVYAPSSSEGGPDTRTLQVNILNSANTPCAMNVGGGVIYPANVFPTTHPVMGMPAIMNLSDMDTASHYEAIYLLGTPNIGWNIATQLPATVAAGQSGGTTGTYKNVGARSVQVLVMFTKVTDSITLQIEQNDGSNTVVGSWTGLNYTNVGALFIGNLEQSPSLQGLQLRAVATDTAGAHAPSVFWVAVVVTG